MYVWEGILNERSSPDDPVGEIKREFVVYLLYLWTDQ